MQLVICCCWDDSTDGILVAKMFRPYLTDYINKRESPILTAKKGIKTIKNYDQVLTYYSVSANLLPITQWFALVCKNLNNRKETV